MPTELAPVTPEVLKWARESIGVTIDDAARRAAVTTDRLTAWETGEAEPTVAKLRALAKLYQRPLAVFFLPDPPSDFDAMKDFRRLPGSEDHSWSRPLHKVFRRAVEQREIALELFDMDGEVPAVDLPAVSVSDEPEDAARVARSALGVTLERQFSWRQAEDALAGWIEAVERLGVFVLRTSDVPMAEMRGFSLTGSAIPVIVINALDWPRGQIFTLAHEFVHLMLREGGLCDLLEPASGAARRVEVFCNAVAGAMLMPAASLLDNDVVGPPGEREWEEDVLLQLSRRYGVSQEAVLRRLVTLRRASWDFYLARRERYLDAYAQQREEERARRRESPGGPPPYRMTVRDRGRPYVELVMDAYQRDAISPSSLSRFLGLKLKHVPKLEGELHR